MDKFWWVTSIVLMKGKIWSVGAWGLWATCSLLYVPLYSLKFLCSLIRSLQYEIWYHTLKSQTQQFLLIHPIRITFQKRIPQMFLPWNTSCSPTLLVFSLLSDILPDPVKEVYLRFQSLHSFYFCFYKEKVEITISIECGYVSVFSHDWKRSLAFEPQSWLRLRLILGLFGSFIQELNHFNFQYL